MASLLGAIQTKYDALAAAAFPSATIPPRFEKTAPEIWNDVQLYPPYVLLFLSAGNDLLTFESDDIEETRLVIVAYAPLQDTADLIIKAIRFNGQNKAQLAGFDCGGLPALTEGTLLSMLPTRSPVPDEAPGRGKQGVMQYKTTMEWLISVQRT